jgi:hypothetical protein
MPAFTLKEAANELRISVRRLQDIVKRHPFYYPNGNRKLFTGDNLSAIRTALLEEKLSSEPTRRVSVAAVPSPLHFKEHLHCWQSRSGEADQDRLASRGAITQHD